MNVLSLHQDGASQSPSLTRKAKEANTDSGKDGLAYNCLLKNELLSAGIDDLKVTQDMDGAWNEFGIHHAVLSYKERTLNPSVIIWKLATMMRIESF